jgi:hypothetical protein
MSLFVVVMFGGTSSGSRDSVFRESTKSTSKTVAKLAEKKRGASWKKASTTFTDTAP